MSRANDRAIGIKEPLREEFARYPRYLVIRASLYVCLGASELYKAALFAKQGVRCMRRWSARAKALIPGKFVPIGQSVRIVTAR